jgi:hypothetical protein
MSRGLGRIQRGCLRVIEEYEAAGKMPTTFNIAAEVYRVRPDRHGNRMVSDAQHVATKRALATLRQKGLVSGQQDVKVYPDGRKILARADGGRPGRAVLPLVPKCGLTFRACLRLVCVRARCVAISHQNAPVTRAESGRA